jgi:hypothetical protein
MLEQEKNQTSDLKKESMTMQGGMGAVAWAVLEMFKRGGMHAEEVKQIQQKMTHYFAIPSDEVCNAILSVVEERLAEEKEPNTDIWYS